MWYRHTNARLPTVLQNVICINIEKHNEALKLCVKSAQNGTRQYESPHLDLIASDSCDRDVPFTARWRILNSEWLRTMAAQHFRHGGKVFWRSITVENSEFTVAGEWEHLQPTGSDRPLLHLTWFDRFFFILCQSHESTGKHTRETELPRLVFIWKSN